LKLRPKFLDSDDLHPPLCAQSKGPSSRQDILLIA
jgi:hypothetical protein